MVLVGGGRFWAAGVGKLRLFLQKLNPEFPIPARFDRTRAYCLATLPTYGIIDLYKTLPLKAVVL
jgi:hypothetical protein